MILVHVKSLAVTVALVVVIAVPVTRCTAQEVHGIEKLGPAINSERYDESSPVLSKDGSRLYFTRTGSPEFARTLMSNGTDLSRQLSEQELIDELSWIYSGLAEEDIDDPIGSSFNQDVWYAMISGEEVKGVHHPGPPLNNALPNSIVSIGPGDASMIAINQFYSDGSMYEGFSIVEAMPGDSFAFPRPLHMYDFYNLSGDVSLSMSNDGLILVLSLEREDSFGKNDLYVSYHISEDLWTAPIHISGSLNSPYHESTPYISHDRRSLYFSSDRPGSVGKTDIWVSERLDYTWTTWSEPRRLPEPINSEYDDAQACLDEAHKYFYFSSKRDGSSDIYRALLDPPPRLEKPLYLSVRIVDAETNKPIQAEAFWGPADVENYLEYYRTNTGLFQMVIKEPEVVKFYARKPNYEPATLLFDALLAAKQDLEVYNVVLKLKFKGFVEDTSENARANASSTNKSVSEQLAEMEVGEAISFYNIYFERTTPHVLPASEPALDDLVQGMVRNPAVTIQIEGHTDNVGNERDLMELSWQRAEAVKEYLVEHGVATGRIAVMGYGGNKPVSENYTEEGRSRNRRVEIRITGK